MNHMLNKKLVVTPFQNKTIFSNTLIRFPHREVLDHGSMPKMWPTTATVSQVLLLLQVLDPVQEGIVWKAEGSLQDHRRRPAAGHGKKLITEHGLV